MRKLRVRKRKRVQQQAVEELKNVAKAADGNMTSATELAAEKFVSAVAAGENATQMRLRMYRLLTRDVVEIAGSRGFFETYKPNKILTNSEKDSTSKSVISFGTIRANSSDPALKAELELLSTKLVCVKYAAAERGSRFRLNESKIYAKVGKLVEQNYTPNIMLSFFQFNMKSVKLSFATGSGIDPQLYKAITDVNRAARASEAVVIVTEAGKGITLHSLPATHADMYPILFQVLFTIDQLSVVGVTHYDLHFGNVFLQKTDPTDNAYVYFISDNEYVLVTNAEYFPRLYDWDLSYADGLSFPGRGWLCSVAGGCDQLNPPYDAHRLLMYGMGSKLPSDVQRWIRRAFAELKTRLPPQMKADPNLDFNPDSGSAFFCKLHSEFLERRKQPTAEKTRTKTRQCDGSIRDYLRVRYGVDSFTESTTSYLPWPRPLYVSYAATFKTKPGIALKTLQNGGYDPRYVPGTSFFASHVYFARQVDRKKAEANIQRYANVKPGKFM